MEQRQLIFLDGKKYDISGQGGNAFCILGDIQSYLEQCRTDRAEIEEFMTEAKSKDYTHLLQTCTAATGIEFLDRGEKFSNWLN